MKKLFLFVAAALVFSCSDDTNPTDTNQLKLPSTITYNEGAGLTIFYTMTYDGDNRIAKIVGHREYDDAPSFNGEDVYEFVYDTSDRIISINRTGSNPHLNEFTYDADGRVSSWSHDGATPHAITYEDGTYYHNQLHVEYTLTSHNDLAMRGMYQQTYVSVFNHESGKKGAFADVAGNIELLGIYLEGGFVAIGSREPLTSIVTNPVYSTTFVNSYDQDGYLTGFTGTNAHADLYPWAIITYGE